MKIIFQKIYTPLLFAIFSLGYSGFTFSQDEINANQLQAMNQALNNREFEKAWIMASSLQEQYEGLSEFDFIFARAAIESKEYELAIFALNRVLIDEPNNFRIHLEMGRALFFNNNLPQAKNHFNFVLESAPPSTVSDKISQYNQAIDSILNQRATTIAKSVVLTVGTTDNVNSGPNSLTLTPEHNELQLTQLSEESEKRSDSFVNIIASYVFQKPLTNTSSIKNSASINLKQGGDPSGLTKSVSLSASSAYTTAFKKYTFTPFTQLSLNNSNHDFSGVGLILGVQSPYKFTQKLFLNSALNYSLNSDSNLSISNTNLSFANSLTYSQNKHTHTASLTFIGFSLNDESLSHSAFNALNLNYSLNSTISSKFNNTFVTSYMNKLYKDTDPLFLDPDDLNENITRFDSQIVISNQITYAHKEKQQFFAKLNALEQISNIEIYNLTKFDITLGVNLQF